MLIDILFLKLNQLKEAEVALIEANKIDNCNVDVWGYLCLLNLSLNRYEEFAQCYRQAIKVIVIRKVIGRKILFHTGDIVF